MEHLLFVLEDRAVRFRADVQQQRAVLADDIYEFIHDLAGVLVDVVGDVAPGIARDGGAGLPNAG